MTTRGRWMAFCALIGLMLGLVRGQNDLSLLSLSVLIWIAFEWACFQWRLARELPRIHIERTVNGRSEASGCLWAGRTISIAVRIELIQRRHAVSWFQRLRKSRYDANEHAYDSKSTHTESIQQNPGDRPNHRDDRNILSGEETQDSIASSRKPGDSILDVLHGVCLIRDVVPENLEVLTRCGEAGNVEGNHFELRTAVGVVEFGYLARARSAGKIELPGVRFQLEDAQGFFRVERFVAASQSFRVFPAFADAGEPQPIVKRINAIPQQGIHRVQRSGMGSELLELRDYVAGDPPKSIAWKVSARRGKLMTRQYESEVPVRVQLFLDGSRTTRIGGFGRRLLDQMTFVAASVARSAISVGDPVGLTLMNEDGVQRHPRLVGERGFHKLLELMSEFSMDAVPPPLPLTRQMIRSALSLISERYPELLDGRINQTPVSWFPILPWNRRRFHERCHLAAVLAEILHFDVVDQSKLIHEDQFLAGHLQRFLTESGVAWMSPLVAVPDRRSLDFASRAEWLGDAMMRSVNLARDNEVFVVLADLKECVAGLSRLMPFVKMALARHHRVAFVCPSPTFRRPTRNSIAGENNTVEELIAAAEQVRVRSMTTHLQRELRRAGATLSCSGETEAVSLILSEMELARTGRVGSAGGRR